MANHPDLITDALMRALSFMEGFEGDELQEGLEGPDGDLDVIRRALAERENRSLNADELAALGEPVPMSPDVTYTAMCLWEAVLEDRDGGPWARYIQGHGTHAVRDLVMGFAASCDRAWNALGEDGQDAAGCFDWEFCPKWLREAVDWAGPLPRPITQGEG